MSLDAFLSHNRAEIIKRTRIRAATRSSPPTSAFELEQGVPIFLSQLSAILKTPAGGRDEAPSGSHSKTSAISQSAGEHGLNLLKFGFTIEHVVHGYGDVCQAVTELAGELGATLSIGEFQTLNRCLDDAIAGAVTSWSQGREANEAKESDARKARLVQPLDKECRKDAAVSVSPKRVPIIGKHFSSFYPPEDVAAGKCEQELKIATREGSFKEEGWRVRKDGTRLWTDVTITALRDPDSGKRIGFAKVTRDLTERRAAEEQRLRNEEYFCKVAAEKAALEAREAAETEQRVRREFLGKAGEALAASLDYRTTLATVTRLAVPQLADWCSVELTEPGPTPPLQVAVAHADPSKIQYARELAERYPPDPNARTGAPQVIRSGKSELYVEIPAAFLEAGAVDSEHLRLIQELRLESAMIVPMTGRDRVLGAISFIYANSGRRYTESDLAFAEDFARRAAMAIENAQAHAALSATLEFNERFVAVLAHDLCNPLAAIDMAVGVLRRRATTDDSAARLFERITSSSRRMARMIEQVLDLTRSRLAGGLAINPEPMDLCDTLTGIVNEVRTAHPSRNVVLRCEPLSGIWDRDRLEQVFSNVIANAIHHGTADKAVTVEARQEENGAVRVDVHNAGEPIPEELRVQLFNPFRRGSRDSRASKTAGLGLGLYISQQIAIAHGGRLDVQSSSADGTTFRITLPRTILTSAPH